MTAASVEPVLHQPHNAPPKALTRQAPTGIIRSRIKLPWLIPSPQPLSDRMPGSYDTNEFPDRKKPVPSAVDEPLQKGSQTVSTAPASLAPVQSSQPRLNDRASQDGSSAREAPSASGSASQYSNISDPFKDPPLSKPFDARGNDPTMAPSNPALRPYSSTQSLARVVTKPRSRQWSASMTSQPFRSRQSTKRGTAHSNDKVVSKKASQGQYTPSKYDSTPPSERDMPTTLPRKDPASYERLLKIPQHPSPVVASRTIYFDAPTTIANPDVPEPSKSPTWPMVPLSELEIGVPIRVSSLGATQSLSRLSSQASAPSNMGRYNDGTLSRKPTVRTSVTFQSPDVSPKTQSPPSSSSPDNETRKLEKAVTGLQNLMEEALTVAKDAAHNNRTEDVAQILDEAKLALRKASTVHGYMTSPLRIEDSSDECYSSDDYVQDSGSDSDADVESIVSSIQPIGKPSSDTIPTAYTKSKSGLSLKPALTTAANKPLALRDPRRPQAFRSSIPIRNESIVQPVISPPFTVDGKRPSSQEASMEPSSSGSFSMTQTPPRMYPNSIASAARDWAYTKPPPTRCDLRGGSEPGPVAQDDLVLPPPPGERASVVLPPIIPQDASVTTPEQYQSHRLSVPVVPNRRSLRPVQSDPQLSLTSTPVPQATTGMTGYPVSSYPSDTAPQIGYPAVGYPSAEYPALSGTAPPKR